MAAAYDSADISLLLIQRREVFEKVRDTYNICIYFVCIIIYTVLFLSECPKPFVQFILLFKLKNILLKNLI